MRSCDLFRGQFPALKINLHQTSKSKNTIYPSYYLARIAANLNTALRVRNEQLQAGKHAAYSVPTTLIMLQEDSRTGLPQQASHKQYLTLPPPLAHPLSHSRFPILTLYRPVLRYYEIGHFTNDTSSTACT
mgnify:FL=1